MRYFFLSLLLAVTTLSVTAQTEKPASKLVADKLQQFYNQGDYTSVFTLFSPEMQKNMPLDKATEFLTGLKNLAGNIKSRTFSSYNANGAASYKTTFDKGVYSLLISLDDQGKMTSIFIQSDKPGAAGSTP